MQKSLDAKLDVIRRGEYRPEHFIIADAKDGDMGGGITAFGPAEPGSDRSKSKPAQLASMREIVETGLVDVMLMSASAAEVLVGQDVFRDSPVTPAVRLNDATDIWGPRHSGYKAHPAQDYRSARVGRMARLVDIGLYSITFSNDIECDLAFLRNFHRFLDDIAGSGLRYFLEVFNPQIDVGIPADQVPEYFNDCVVRCLAGLTKADMPQFLKIPFNGPRATEEICSYDPGRIIVGVLGGGAGTTRDTLELVRQSEKYGARVALFGRKIQFSEDPERLLNLMRAVLQGESGTEEAVRDFHDHLARSRKRPLRSLETDLQVTDPILMHDL